MQGLDAYITGNWGEDQFKGIETTVCDHCLEDVPASETRICFGCGDVVCSDCAAFGLCEDCWQETAKLSK